MKERTICTLWCQLLPDHLLNLTRCTTLCTYYVYMTRKGLKIYIEYVDVHVFAYTFLTHPLIVRESVILAWCFMFTRMHRRNIYMHVHQYSSKYTWENAHQYVYMILRYNRIWKYKAFFKIYICVHIYLQTCMWQVYIDTNVYKYT